jgi:LacI family transcriptional regulator
MSQTNVTLDQVGRRAGVSAMTVSRVLNGDGKKTAAVRPVTRQRVMRAAAELGYCVNTAARAMARGRFESIALVLSADLGHSRLAPMLLRGIVSTCENNGQSLNLATLTDRELTDASILPQILRQRHADGLLINYTHDIPRTMLELINAHSIPSVLMNAERDRDCVRPDDFGAGRRAVEHLVKLGHRRVAYVDYSHGTDELPGKHYSARHRCDGYVEAMRQAGLTPQIIRNESGPVPYRERPARSRAWLTAADRPTGVVAYSSDVSAVIAATVAALGLALPDDLSLVELGDGAAALHTAGVDCTRLFVPEGEVGRQAVAMVLERIDEPGKTMPVQTIPFNFVEGESSARPAATPHDE